MLNVKNLRTYFHTRNGIIKAVDDISFQVHKGKILGIAGESGSGKTVACLSLLGLIPSPPGVVESGTAMFNDTDLLKCTKKQIRKIRGDQISMIFQDPMTSLNPYLPVKTQLCEHLLIHTKISKKDAANKAIALLSEVGIQDPNSCMKRFPHELSGGMCQRIMIAMALITEPDLIIADEPTTALDVTIQAQILELLKRIQQQRNTSVIFITHDLGVLAQIADTAIIMYAGNIMERGKTRQIFNKPAHPYTKALLRAIPASCPIGKKLYTIPGMPPDLSLQTAGCMFAPRCKYVKPFCYQTHSEIKPVSPDHYSACLRVQDESLFIDEL